MLETISNDMDTKNQAAWLLAPQDHPLVVRSAPRTEPGTNEILIRTAAVAVNPLDGIIQSTGPTVFPHLTYPRILGSDVAGTVIAVGGSSGGAESRFRPGDRVLGLAMGFFHDRSAEGGFQTLVLLRQNMAAHIPPDLPFTSACVLPQNIATAACALFHADTLALPSLPALPSAAAAVPPSTSLGTLLICSGASSVGLNAIQLARAAGYQVFTTASPSSHPLLLRLGAARVFDYHSSTLQEDLLAAFTESVPPQHVAGALVVHAASLSLCLNLMRDLPAVCTPHRFVATCAPPGPRPEDIPQGVRCKFFLASSVQTSPVSSAVYADFLPAALAKGTYECEPQPEIVGRGLEAVQGAIEKQRSEVRGKKVVVVLEEDEEETGI